MITIFLAILIISSVLIWIKIQKKRFFKQPAHLIGLRKRKQLVLKDERLFPFLWEMNTWAMWTISAAFTFLFSTILWIIVLINSIPRDDITLLFFDLIMSAIVTGACLSCWRTSKIKFERKMNEWGIVLEKDEDAIKAIHNRENKRENKWHIIMVMLWITLFLFHFVRFISEGRILFAVFSAGLVVFAIFTTISRVIKSRKSGGKE